MPLKSDINSMPCNNPKVVLVKGYANALHGNDVYRDEQLFATCLNSQEFDNRVEKYLSKIEDLKRFEDSESHWNKVVWNPISKKNDTIKIDYKEVDWEPGF